LKKKKQFSREAAKSQREKRARTKSSEQRVGKSRFRMEAVINAKALRRKDQNREKPSEYLETEVNNREVGSGVGQITLLLSSFAT
jgi:hypothetical protein